MKMVKLFKCVTEDMLVYNDASYISFHRIDKTLDLVYPFHDISDVCREYAQRIDVPIMRVNGDMGVEYFAVDPMIVSLISRPILNDRERLAEQLNKVSNDAILLEHTVVDLNRKLDDLERKINSFRVMNIFMRIWYAILNKESPV